MALALSSGLEPAGLTHAWVPPVDLDKPGRRFGVYLLADESELCPPDVGVALEFRHRVPRRPSRSRR